MNCIVLNFADHLAPKWIFLVAFSIEELSDVLCEVFATLKWISLMSYTASSCHLSGCRHVTVFATRNRRLLTSSICSRRVYIASRSKPFLLISTSIAVVHSHHSLRSDPEDTISTQKLPLDTKPLTCPTSPPP
jgi:hypothetical protein